MLLIMYGFYSITDSEPYNNNFNQNILLKMKKSSLKKEIQFDHVLGEFLLKASKTLVSGQITPLFIYKLVDQNIFHFTCRLCGVTSSSDIILKKHITGKRHLNNLQLPTLELVNQDTQLLSKVKKIIDSCDEPLVGAEYIIEIKQIELNSQPLYRCLLCHKEKKKSSWDDRELNVHLLSNHHRLKFLQQHFSSAFKIIKNSPVRRESAQLNILLTFVCDKIEATYGRLMPKMCIGQELKLEAILMRSKITYLHLKPELVQHLVISIGHILNIYETKRKTLFSAIMSKTLVST